MRWFLISLLNILVNNFTTMRLFTYRPNMSDFNYSPKFPGNLLQMIILRTTFLGFSH